MNKITKELLEVGGLQESPTYTEDDLRDIAKKLAETKDEKAGKVYAILLTTQYDPFLLETWCEEASEEYDYRGLFFTSLDNIPMAIVDMEDLDSIEDTVIRWRLHNAK